MHDIFSVSLKELIKPFIVSLPVGTVTISVSNTPAAPASVGVKIPAYNPPMTSAKIDRASITPVSDLIFSFMLVLGPAGPNPGLMRHRMTMVSTNKSPRRRAGKIPPKKSLIMDCSVCRPIIISKTLGGITVPRVPPVTTVPALNRVS